MRQASYTYDEVGNRTSVVDYNGHRGYFQYDALNRRRQTNSTASPVFPVFPVFPGQPEEADGPPRTS